MGSGNLILEFAAGVDTEQSRTDFRDKLLSDQLKTRLERVDNLKFTVFTVRWWQQI